MKTKVKTMFISTFILTLVSSCGSLPAQKVEISQKSVEDLRLISAKKSSGSRSARFLQCVKDLSFEGIKQELLVSVCEAAMGSIR